MVKLHYKQSDSNQFLFETVCSAPVEDTIKELVEVNNLRNTLDKLSMFTEDLANHGPLKPEDIRGLTSEDTIQPALEMMKPEIRSKWSPPYTPGPNQRYNEDKSGYRTGVILSQDLTQILLQEIQKARELIHKDNVSKKLIINAKQLKEAIDNIRGAVMIGYPAYHSLGDWEPARQILEGTFDMNMNPNDNITWMEAKDTAIWWAGKELLRGKLLQDYIGKNEKTTIVIKLQKVGAGAPVREPPIDQEQYKNMLSFYHKKQEEAKKLEEENDDNYLDSAWANPKGLKSYLIGGGKDISWKPK